MVVGGKTNTGTFDSIFGPVSPKVIHYAQTASSWLVSGNKVVYYFVSTPVYTNGCVAQHSCVGVIHYESDGIVSEVTFYTSDEDVGKVGKCLARLREENQAKVATESDSKGDL